MVAANRQHAAVIHHTGIQTFFNAHDAHSCFAIPGKDCSFDGGCATPTWQQRKMHVDHRHLRQHRHRNDASVSNNHTQVCTNGKHIVHVVTHRQTQFTSCHLHRAWRHTRPATTSLVRARDHQCNFYARGNQGLQRWHCHFGCTEIHHASRGTSWQGSKSSDGHSHSHRHSHEQRICVTPVSGGMVRHLWADLRGCDTT